MKKVLILGLLVATVVSVGIAATKPPSAGFVVASADTSSGGWLIVTFKEVGLTPGGAVTYNFSANSSATWGCVVNKSNRLTGSTVTISAPVSASEEMSASMNGSVVDGMAVEPPGPPTTGLTCAAGTSIHLVKTTYWDVQLYDNTTKGPGGLEAPLTGSCASECSETIVK